MEKIKDVLIQGAGALGAAYAALFYDAGLSVSFVARGERHERLEKFGIVVNDTAYHIPVAHPDEPQHPADLIIVALKDQHLQGAVGDLKNFIGADTIILSVMNGLDSEAILGEAYGIDKMLYAIAVGIDALRVGNRVDFTVTGKILFGEVTNREISARVRQVQNAFERAGISYETPEDMLRVLWWKFMVNVGMNQASAVMGAPYGVFQTSPDARDLMRALMHEVILLAVYEGVNLNKNDIEEWDRFLNTLSPGGKTSMLQDIEAGRETEVEIFGGKVVQLGEQYGVPTPVNQTMLSAVRVLQSTAKQN